MKVKSRIEVVNEAVDRLISVAVGARRLDDPSTTMLIQELPLPICILRAVGRGDMKTAVRLLDVWAGYEGEESDSVRSMK